MAEAGTQDAFGHAQLGGVGPLIATLVKDKLGYKYHWAVADYLQRAARHLASKTDVEHSLRGGQGGGRAGARRAQRGDAGDHAHVATSRTAGRSPWRRSTKVANVEKMLPRDFITTDGYGITAKARAYLAPLIRGEDPPPFKDGLPQYVRLKNVAVPKKLATDVQGLTRRRRDAGHGQDHRLLLHAGLAVTPTSATTASSRWRARHGAAVDGQAGRPRQGVPGLGRRCRCPSARRSGRPTGWSSSRAGASYLGHPDQRAAEVRPGAGDLASRWILAAAETGPRAGAGARRRGDARALGRGARHRRPGDAGARSPAALGLDAAALAARAETPEIAARYDASTQEAIDRQVFGAPWYVYDGEPFWGQDRLDFLDRALAK